MPFDSRPGLESVANEQGVEPADDFNALLGDFWPEGEDVDEFLASVRRPRQEDSEAQGLPTDHRHSKTHSRSYVRYFTQLNPSVESLVPTNEV